MDRKTSPATAQEGRIPIFIEKTWLKSQFTEDFDYKK
jgi:hypothetical protein